MKKIGFILSVVASLTLFSCDQDIDFPYEGKDRIHFRHFTTSNTGVRQEFKNITKSMGLLNDTIVSDTAKIVVELAGRLSDKTRSYKLSIVADSTTAGAGEHYEVLNMTQSFRANKITDTLRIVLNREKFNPSYLDKEDKILYLKLEPTDDFDLGLAHGQQMKIILNNYITEPAWWKVQQGGGFGFFHVKKWKILITFDERFATYSDLPFDMNSPEHKEYRRGLESYLQQIATYDDYTGDKIEMHRLVPQK